MPDFGISEKKAAALAARMEQLGIREGNLRERFITGGGPGGQKINRSATCVQLVHEPTGTEVKMQRARSQGLNRYYARKRLCELLEARTLGQQSPEEKKREKLRKQKKRRKRRSPSASPEPDRDNNQTTNEND
ncbi:MAG: peptide chain release factor family protein [Candidatus Hydrogenedentota bacterium]